MLDLAILRDVVGRGGYMWIEKGVYLGIGCTGLKLKRTLGAVDDDLGILCWE